MEDQRFGLLVANSEFESPSISRLHGPPVDVASLADVLRRVDIGGFQIETVVNCYRTAVEAAIQEFFGELKRDDLALLYFAGHGLKNDKGNLYFPMRDTKRRLLESTALSSRFIHEMIQNSSARRQVLILDCCFSGAFPRGFTFKADESIDSGHYFDAKGSGQLILTACDEMQYAFEGDDLIEKNVISSVFTGILIDGFTSGNADVDLDGQISFKDVYEYAVAEMRSRGSAQIPQRWHFGLDDLILASNPNQGVKAIAEELRIRIESPDARVKLQAAYDLGELARASGSRRALAAYQGLEKLAADDSRTVSDLAKGILRDLKKPTHIDPPPPPRKRWLMVWLILGGALFIASVIFGVIRFSGSGSISVVTPTPTIVPMPTSTASSTLSVVPVPTSTPSSTSSVVPSPTPTPIGPISIATAFYVRGLGLRVAFITLEQSQETFDAMPPGALVMEVESNGAAGKAGINAGDVVEAIGSQKIDTLDDMRKAFRGLGPGKTQFTIRRSEARLTILVDCPNC
jgi:hypothetical protein